MKTSYLKFIIFAIFLCSNLVLIAQNSTHFIKGIVVEMNVKGTFLPVIGASVHWAGTQIGTVTDTSGVFKIQSPQTIPPSGGLLVISFVGMQSDTLAITEANMHDIRVVLKNETSLNEIVITAEKSSTMIDFLNPIKANLMTEKELFKAACCNLSESFETNPSIDVNFADAVTGAKQIQMLGLAGIYTQIMTENLPAVRGLSANYGLSFIPGSWIESIQVTKGIGSVVNGYESVAGQINTELHKPFGENRLFFNAYTSDWGRYEANLVINQKVHKYWSTSFLLHSNLWNAKMDENHDGFLDMPLGSQINGINRWQLDNHKGLSAQIGVKLMTDTRTGGQGSHNEMPTDTTHIGHTMPKYEVKINTEKYEAWGKFGYVFPQKKYKSIGLMSSFTDYSQDATFGNTTYIAKQKTGYSNLIYQSIINNTNHKFRTGLSFLYDNYEEFFSAIYNGNFKRTEIVAGAFFEYTWTATPKLSFVAGLRTDTHNLFGLIITPRLHAKYELNPTTILRLSAGSGQRTANIFAENSAIFVSSRQVDIVNRKANSNTTAYGLKPEKAWNFGINLTKDFRLLGNTATLEVDYYRTDFINQVITDLDNSSQKVLFYNLTDNNGQSYSNSLQAQLTYEPIYNMEWRMAYRLVDVHTTYGNQLLERYLLARDRAFMNIGYKIFETWNIDYTLSWFGKKRIPNTQNSPVEFQKNAYSPDYFLMNMQITKSIGKRLDIYLGLENILDFRQTDLIINAKNPYNNYFDASLVWGTVQGRMFYGGLRYKIKTKK
jgi:outer membrane receptor for ferrienterochelin and colicins